jgi:maleylacetoacetate isomerase
MSETRRLSGFFRSSTSYRVRIALALKGLEWEGEAISLPRMEHRTDAFLARNPQGLVPVLEDGGRSYAQSLAIIEYLEERYPDPPLLPAGIEARHYVRALSLIIACDIHPLNNIRVLKYLETPLGLDRAVVGQWYRHWVAAGLAPFEAMLAREGRIGRYCCGDQVTMADICLLPQLANAQRFDCALEDYPLAVAIGQRLAALPAVSAVRPGLQPDSF